MLDYGFTEYQTAIRELAREIAEKEIRPIAAEYDREAKFPWPIVKLLADADLFRVYVDEKYEGLTDGTPIMKHTTTQAWEKEHGAMPPFQ